MKLILYFLICIFDRAIAARIGLFASTGCYSHDMLMRNLADRLTIQGAHRVTIIQIRVYEFNRTIPEAESHWQYVSFNCTGPDSAALQRHSQRFMWLTTIPFDPDAFSIESTRILSRIHTFHMRACFRALRDDTFMNELRNLNLDLLVIDYLMNECAIGLAYVLNVNTIYLSNYPVVSSYVDTMGVSSNPAYVPAVIGAEKLPMNLRRRSFNTFLYALLFHTRRHFYDDVRKVFEIASDIRLPSLLNAERRTLMFATPFEFILDAPRPLVAGLRYFGCEHCTQSGPNANISQVLSLTDSKSGYILVSFGTVTRGDLIPLIQLERLFVTFAKFTQYTIIWQLDASKEYFERDILLKLNTTSIPNHIRIFKWLPLKNILADPRVIMLVSHGGVTTCIEAVNNGVPVLGISIQGDQSYNLQRFVEKGVGEFLQVSKLNENVLYQKMQKMIQENKRYKQAALKLRSMLNDYKSLDRSPAVFWLGWTARHFSDNDTKSKTRKERFILSKHASNWLFYYDLDCLLIFLLFSFIIVCWTR